MAGWRRVPFALLWKIGRALELAARASIYLAAGTLRLRDLRGAIANSWEEFGRSEAAIRSGLMHWERALYGRFLKPEDRVLVVGCGTGRDLIALGKLGYRVEGLDVGPRSIALARQMLEREGLSAKLYTGAIEALALPGSFDAFIFSWFCYGYIPQADTRVGVLHKVKAHLNPGGRILISYIPADRPPRALPIRLTQLAARLTESDWRPELGDVIGSAAGNGRAIHYEHHFSKGELENEARAAGLTIVFHEPNEEATAVLMA
jgi:SAM-dependent methyltransferase